ncbi:MAG: hypothetical protein JWM10_3919 [Myxococcaceae bacterium]|nr:hypothetical protein [Myxococcaceae bacterium]
MPFPRAALALALALVSGAASAQSPREIPRWPERAWGQAIPVDGVRPTGEVGVLRSLRAPVDVHVMPGVSAEAALAVLADAEAVMDALERRTGVALPLPDGDRGGSPSFDLYLAGDLVRGEAVVDALSYAGPWDRATAFGVVNALGDPDARRRRLAQAIAEACIYGAKADHPIGFVRAMGASLARRATELPLDPDDVRAFQSEPTRAWWSDDARSPAAQRGAAAVLDAMAARWDDDRGTFLRGLLEAPVQLTPHDSPRFWNEPDVMEVLKRVTREEPRGFWGALLAGASARMVLDAPLAAAPARTAQWSELPAWTTVTGVAPTGHAAMTLDLGLAPRVTAVGVWVHASPYTRWVASVLRVGPDGHIMGTVDSELISTGEWSARLDALEGVAKLVVVVVSAGDENLDPDGEPIRDGWVAINLGRI